MSEKEGAEGDFVFDLTGGKSFLRKFGKDEVEELQTFISGMIDDDVLDRHFSKRLREEVRLFWEKIDADLYGERVVVFPDPDHDYLEPRKFDFYQKFVEGLESARNEDLPHTEALLLKCLEEVRSRMKGSAR